VTQNIGHFLCRLAWTDTNKSIYGVDYLNELTPKIHFQKKIWNPIFEPANLDLSSLLPSLDQSLTSVGVGVVAAAVEGTPRSTAVHLLPERCERVHQQLRVLLIHAHEALYEAPTFLR
jgi:hypothetical protein